MKFLLVAVNAKYIHSNLGIYSLKAYAEQEVSDTCKQIEIGEYTINHQMDLVLRDIYLRKPDVIGFSCYIWNISYVLELTRDLHKVLPDTELWLGGPEVSFNAREILETEKQLRGIMKGEGEEIFARLVSCYLKWNSNSIPKIAEIPGIAVRLENASLTEQAALPVMDMNKIPFVYDDLNKFEHKIIYYESSRGCPFSCSYCLSSIDKSVRFRDTELVKKELGFFLENKVSQVKFVDRTFNCRKSHAMEIWNYILTHDNGITNFHFEISADLLDDEELDLIRQMRPGLIQLEIGVQSTNSDTIQEIHRKMDLKKLKERVDIVNGFHNVHQHLDLIAGLPYEDYDSFRQSFNDVYAMHPEQLQLGFLKVLKGSYMEEMTQQYDLQYKGLPPYEVLSTKWMGYEDILRLKSIEEMVETYYNSRQFSRTVEMLEHEFKDTFTMYEELAQYYETHKLLDLGHSRIARYELLFDFICKRGITEERIEEFRDSLMYDLYLRENVKSRPAFARDQSPYKTVIRDVFIEEEKNPKRLTGYEGYDSKQMSKMAHAEVMRDGSLVLFDYRNRDPLTYNAATYTILNVSGTAIEKA